MPLDRAFATIIGGPIRRHRLALPVRRRVTVATATTTTKVPSALHRTRLSLLATGMMVVVMLMILLLLSSSLVRVMGLVVTALTIFWLL